MLRDLLYSTTWYNPLFEHINSTSFNALEAFVDNEYSTYKAINPDYNDIFKAYNITHFDDVKVIIIGQDPYHTPHKATGIAFQMPINTAINASLRNIYNEIYEDYGGIKRTSNDITDLSKQGVLLINTILTVQHNKPLSHINKGWEAFTTHVLNTLSTHHNHYVFMLWGQYAYRYKHCIDASKHLILHTTHPSPLSYTRGFKGCKHFSMCNTYLIKHDKKPILWG